MTLTEKQAAVLNYIRECGTIPPTMREIAEIVGSENVAAAQHHIDALEHKGFVKRDRRLKPRGRSRNIELVPSIWSAMGFWLPIKGKVK